MDSILTVVTAVATVAIVGCTYERPVREIIEPSYSYRQAMPTLTAERIWPVNDTRTARDDGGIGPLTDRSSVP